MEVVFAKTDCTYVCPVAITGSHIASCIQEIVHSVYSRYEVRIYLYFLDWKSLILASQRMIHKLAHL